jgi:hypothetical protein
VAKLIALQGVMMNSLVVRWRLLRGLLVLALAWTLLACATAPALVDHGFGFDAVADSPGVDVLDYRYGRSNAPGTHMPDWIRSGVGASGGTNTYGSMEVADTLYVKWRVRATGEVREQTLDLKNRLPKDMARHTIYLVFAQRQVVVYLISPEARPEGSPRVGPARFARFKVDTIYRAPAAAD